MSNELIDESLLDLLLKELPEEDELDVDWSLQEQNLEPDDSPPKHGMNSVLDVGVKPIASRTRRRVDLKNKDIEDLTQQLRVGDWEEGGKEYETYLKFLSSLNDNKDSGYESDETIDDEFRVRLRNSSAGPDYSRRPKTRRTLQESSPLAVDLEVDQVSKQKHRVVAPLLPTNIELFPPCEISERRRVCLEVDEETSYFTQEQLEHLYMQIHAHTQLLLQAAVGWSTVSFAETLHHTPCFAMLKEISQRYSVELLEPAKPYKLWSMERKPILRTCFHPEHCEQTVNSEIQTVLDNPLVKKLTYIVFDPLRMRIHLKASKNELLEDLEPYLNFLLSAKGRKVSLKNKNQLWLPSEDALLALAILEKGLNYTVIHNGFLAAKTPKQIKYRVSNLMQRCKGNAVRTAVTKLRLEPLSDVEKDLVRKGLERHGRKWITISKDFIPTREPSILCKLWEEHMKSSSSDRILTYGQDFHSSGHHDTKNDSAEDKILRSLDGIGNVILHDQSKGPSAPQNQAIILAEGNKDVVDQACVSSTNQNQLLGVESTLGLGCQDEHQTYINHLNSKPTWSAEYDRILLISVKEFGENPKAFFDAQNRMGGTKSPFSQREIMERYQWLAAKFMQANQM